MFARLRGVPEKQIKEVVEIEITRLDLKKHADKRCGKYRFVKTVTQIDKVGFVGGGGGASSPNTTNNFSHPHPHHKREKEERG